MGTNLYFEIKINVQGFCLLLAKKGSFPIQIGFFPWYGYDLNKNATGKCLLKFY